MYIHESGPSDAPAIVFLHGNGANGTMWQEHVERLGDFHCLAPDFPGYGRSNEQEWNSLSQTAAQVAVIIRTRTARGIAHIVGLSLGGSVALTMLARVPEVIDHAVIDGAGATPLPALPLMRVGFRLMQPFLHTDFVIRTIARSTRIADEEYQAFKRGMLEMSPSSFTRSFLEASALRQPPGLRQVTCPTLFVAGEREPETVKRSQAEMAELMPKGQRRIAPGMGHGWLAEAPDLHCRMVRAWVSNQALPEELRTT